MFTFSLNWPLLIELLCQKCRFRIAQQIDEETTSTVHETPFPLTDRQLKSMGPSSIDSSDSGLSLIIRKKCSSKTRRTAF